MIKKIVASCIAIFMAVLIANSAIAQSGQKKLLKAPLASSKNILWMTVSISEWNTKKGDINIFSMCPVGTDGMFALGCSGKGYTVFGRGAAFDKNLHIIRHNKQLYYAAWTKPTSKGTHAYIYGRNGRHKFPVKEMTMTANVQPGTIVVNQRYANSKSSRQQAMAKAKATAIARFGDVAKGMKVVFMTARSVTCGTDPKNKKRRICKLK